MRQQACSIGSAVLLALLFGLAGCGGSAGNNDDNTSSQPVIIDGDRQLPGTGSQIPPDTAAACASTADCFDLSAAYVARFKGNRQAAASYTFDDGNPSSFATAELFESHGLRASFYIVPATVPESAWPKWRGLAERGHEVGNHSMTHTIDLGQPTVTDEQLRIEIIDAQHVIGDRIGTVPQVFAFPWHASSHRSSSMALQTHLTIRSPRAEHPFTMAFFDQEHGNDLAEQLQVVNRQLDQTVAAAGWYVAAGHGIDGDGWSPVTTQFLADHLAHAQAHSSRLWIDTFDSVARYRMCRQQANAYVGALSSRIIKVRLEGKFGTMCTAPLTVVVPMPGTPAHIEVRDEHGNPLQSSRQPGLLLIDLQPGARAFVEIG